MLEQERGCGDGRYQQDGNGGLAGCQSQRSQQQDRKDRCDRKGCGPQANQRSEGAHPQQYEQAVGTRRSQLAGGRGLVGQHDDAGSNHEAAQELHADPTGEIESEMIGGGADQPQADKGRRNDRGCRAEQGKSHQSDGATQTQGGSAEAPGDDGDGEGFQRIERGEGQNLAQISGVRIPVEGAVDKDTQAQHAQSALPVEQQQSRDKDAVCRPDRDRAEVSLASMCQDQRQHKEHNESPGGEARPRGSTMSEGSPRIGSKAQRHQS